MEKQIKNNYLKKQAGIIGTRRINKKYNKHPDETTSEKSNTTDQIKDILNNDIIAPVKNILQPPVQQNTTYNSNFNQGYIENSLDHQSNALNPMQGFMQPPMQPPMYPNQNYIENPLEQYYMNQSYPMTGPSMGPPVSQTLGPSMNQSMEPLMGQSLNQTFGPTMNQSMGQMMGQNIDQTMIDKLAPIQNLNIPNDLYNQMPISFSNKKEQISNSLNNSHINIKNLAQLSNIPLI
jgi:hypothetical protein